MHMRLTPNMAKRSMVFCYFHSWHSCVCVCITAGMWFTSRTIGHNQHDEEQMGTSEHARIHIPKRTLVIDGQTADSCTILAKSQSTMWQTCFFRNLQQILKYIKSQILQSPTAKLDKTMVNSLPEFWHRSIMFIYCQLISIKLILRDLLVIYDDLCFEKCFQHLYKLMW